MTIPLAGTDDIEKSFDRAMAEIEDNGGNIVGVSTFMSPNATFVAVIIYKQNDKEEA